MDKRVRSSRNNTKSKLQSEANCEVIDNPIIHIPIQRKK